MGFDEIVANIASELAKKKIQFDKNTDNQIELMELLRTTTSVRQEIMQKISARQQVILEKFKLEEVPKGLMRAIAQDMLEEVTQHGLTTIADIQVGESAANRVYTRYIAASQEEKEDNKNGNPSTYKFLPNIETKKDGTKVIEKFALSSAEISLIGINVVITEESLNKHKKEMKEKHGKKYVTNTEIEALEEDCYIADDGIGAIDTLLKDAKNGDETAAYKLIVYQNAYIEIGKYSGIDKIPQDELEHYLDVIRLLSQIRTPEADIIISQMDAKLPETIYGGVDNNGRVFFNQQVIVDMYKQAGGSIRSVEELQKAYLECAIEFTQNEQIQFESGMDFIQENIIEGQTNKIFAMCDLLDNYARKENQTEDDKIAMAHLMKEIELYSYKYPDAIRRVSLAQQELKEINADSCMLPQVCDLILSYALEASKKAKESQNYDFDIYAQRDEEKMILMKLQNDINSGIVTDEIFIAQMLDTNIDAVKSSLKNMLEQENESHNPIRTMTIGILSSKVKERSEVQATVSAEKGTNESTVLNADVQPIVEKFGEDNPIFPTSTESDGR